MENNLFQPACDTRLVWRAPGQALKPPGHVRSLRKIYNGQLLTNALASVQSTIRSSSRNVVSQAPSSPVFCSLVSSSVSLCSLVKVVKVDLSAAERPQRPADGTSQTRAQGQISAQKTAWAGLWHLSWSQMLNKGAGGQQEVGKGSSPCPHCRVKIWTSYPAVSHIP